MPKYDSIFWRVQWVILKSNSLFICTIPISTHPRMAVIMSQVGGCAGNCIES